MPAEMTMSIDSRYAYLRRMQRLYRQASSRQEKSRLLNAMEETTGLHRKHLIHLMGTALQRQARQRERDRSYGPAVDAALRVIWQAHDYICPERLTNHTVLRTARALAHHAEMALPPSLEEQLAQISVSTVRRHLPAPPLAKQAQRAPQRRKNLLQQQLPAKRIPWDIAAPGHFEVDLVHHCGPETRGEYVYTLQLLDVTTTWSARRAILGRSYVVVADAFLALFEQIPFPILELHPDNGSEFLNHNLIRFLRKYFPAITLSRSHPGRPNDNRYVEQKNHTLVRAYLGDARLDTVTQTRYLNRIYENMSDYYNYLQPVLHLATKEYQPAQKGRPARIRRQHDDPRTPLERLCSVAADPDRCRKLTQHQQILNPLALRNRIHAQLEHLWNYPPATAQRPENVYAALTYPERFPAACAALGLIPNAPILIETE